MADNSFDTLISTSMSPALALGAGMFANVRQRNAELQNSADARNQNMMQFMLASGAQERQGMREQRQFELQTQAGDRAFALQREESAFARLNATLDRQLQAAELDAKNKQQAFDNSLRAMSVALDTKVKGMQLKQFESQLRQADKAERFKDFLGDFVVQKSILLQGDGKAKAAAAVAITDMLRKNSDVLGVDPVFAAHAGEVNAMAMELSTGYFKVLDDADPAVRAKDMESMVGSVDPEDGLDADETQILSVVLEGFRFSAPASNPEARKAELAAHLSGVFGGDAGEGVVLRLVEGLTKNTNAQSKFFEMADRGAFVRPLSTDEIANIKAFRNELKAGEMQVSAALRESNLSPSQRGQVLVAEQRKNELALEQFALRQKGARDPEGIGYLKGGNVLTREAVFEKIKQSPRPPTEFQRGVAAVKKQLYAGPPGRENEPSGLAVFSRTSDSALRYEIARFYQDHVEPIRTSGGALVGDQAAMDSWTADAEKIVEKFGDKYSSPVIREALFYGNHIPSWVAEDRALAPVAASLIPGYQPSFFETPSEAIRRHLVGQYQSQSGQVYAGAVSRSNQILSGGGGGMAGFVAD